MNHELVQRKSKLFKFLAITSLASMITIKTTILTQPSSRK